MYQGSKNALRIGAGHPGSNDRIGWYARQLKNGCIRGRKMPSRLELAIQEAMTELDGMQDN
jgi:hypothetical protein